MNKQVKREKGYLKVLCYGEPATSTTVIRFTMEKKGEKG